MKFIYNPCGISETLSENEVLVLSIENPRIYNEIVGHIYEQVHGGISPIIVSEGEKSLNLSKTAILVDSPFRIDANERSVITKLYHELKENAQSILYQKMITLNGQIVSFLNEVVQSVPYIIDSDSELNLEGLFKLYSLKLAVSDATILERLVDYIKIMARLCSYKLFFLQNIKLFFTPEELGMLYEMASYEKINLVLLEGHFLSHLTGEKNIVIDNDACMIPM